MGDMGLIDSKESDFYRRKLILVVKDVAQYIRDYRGDIRDLKLHKGHEFSSLDEEAAKVLLGAIDTHLPNFEGTVKREARILRINHSYLTEDRPHTIIADELDGTTNMKRHLCSVDPTDPIASAVVVAFATGKTLDTIQIGAIYSFMDSKIYSAMNVGIGDRKLFQTFRDEFLLNPEQFREPKGDSATRVMVIGYSNKRRREKADMEDALFKAGFRPYGDGSRSSTIDLVGILKNQFDAYIDPRALWSVDGDGAVLEAHDVAGALPVVQGCDIVVTDVFGKTMESYDIDSTLPLVVSRPSIHGRILEAIEPVVKRHKRTDV